MPIPDPHAHPDASARPEGGLLHPVGVLPALVLRTDAMARSESGLLHPCEVDWIVAELARAQHDRFARWQLLQLGIGDDLIRKRLGARWRRVRRGVYRLGTERPTHRARWMTDVLACGPDCGLGGTTVLELLDVRRPTNRRTVVVTTRRGRRKPPGIDLRTTRDAEFIPWDGIPITPLPRALADAARQLDDEQLEAAYEKALTNWDMPPSLVPQRNARLNRLIEDHQRGTALTDSDLENLFRTIIKQAGLPQPESNAEVWTGERFYRPDFLWRKQMLVAEVDGDVHLGQREADSRRRAELASIGLHVQPFTRLQLIRRPYEIPAALRPFL